jgi:heme/copper-type cytochrome/quinol oxidase subunit 4
MIGAPPASLTWASRSLAAICALGALATVLIVVLRDDLIRSWAEGRRDIRRILETQGLDAVKDGAVHPPAFVPVAVVMFVVMAGLIWVLAAFLRGGYNWARVALTVLLFFLAVGTIAGLRTGAPPIFVVLSIASFPLEAAAVYFLWHKDTGAFVRGTDGPLVQQSSPR